MDPRARAARVLAERKRQRARVERLEQLVVHAERLLGESEDLAQSDDSTGLHALGETVALLAVGVAHLALTNAKAHLGDN